MGTVPAPNIVQAAQDISAAPVNQLAEFARVANLHQQTADLQQQQQERALQMEQQRRTMADQDALTKAMTQFDPAKHTLADVPGLVTKNGGSGQAALNAQAGLIQQRRNLAAMSDEQFAQQERQADLIAGVHDFVSQAKPEDKQNAYSQGLQRLANAGVDVSKEPAQYPGDDAFAQHEAPIRLHSAIVAEARQDRETSAKESEAATKATEAATTQKRLQEEMPGGSLEAPDKKELRDYLKDPDVDKGVPLEKRNGATFLTWKAKQSPTAVLATSNLLGPGGEGTALDQQAEKYFQTGQLPSGFNRSPQTTAAIIKRANELHTGESLAAGAANYKANQSSLTNLQKNFDQVSAFENTAQKNLDLYLDKLSKIPDLGVKFANVPLRMIDEKMIGSDNYQAMKAAQQVASAEAAKVLGSANASGVLSDTQKKEAEDMLSGNLSYSAAKNVVDTLRTDFGNRHQSYQAQINDIKSRFAGNAGGAGSTAVARPSNATHTGVGTVDKKKHWLDKDGKDLGLAE